MRSFLNRFFASQSAGGIVLGAAALLALAVANSSLGDGYRELLAIRGELRIGSSWLILAKPLSVWINDLWMAVFFFLVGLEIKRELLAGALASPRQAALPAAAALGVLALLGARVPASLKVFLAAVAIIDDLGAIVVIGLFYTDELSLPMLAAAGAGALVLLALNRSRVAAIGPYAIVGLAVWVCVLKSGVHATLAGVVTALAVPLADRRGASPLAKYADERLASIATCTSRSAMSMYWPRPLDARCRSAARIALVAYMPVKRSETATPTFCGPPPGRSSRSPVTLMRPPSPWTMKS